MDPNYDCSRVVEIEDEPRHHLVFGNEFVRGLAVEIGPHERSLCHRHPHDYLLYVASGAEIISSAREEEPKQLSYADGECELNSAGLVHVVENLGDTPFRNIVVELSPRAGELRRGAAPHGAEPGDASVTRVFDDDRAAVFSIEIEPGAEIEISGPAVVATPFGNKLTPAALVDVEITPHPVCDFAWVAPQRGTVLWGCWKQAERVIVFQPGRTEEAGLAVPKVHEPLRSSHAHAEPEDV